MQEQERSRQDEGAHHREGGGEAEHKLIKMLDKPIPRHSLLGQQHRRRRFFSLLRQSSQKAA